MIYFCADDYGVSKESNSRIEECVKNGVLNKISVLPNGEITNFKQNLSCLDTELALHINLVEGYPLSDRKDVSLLITEDGCFKYSFIGLLLLSVSGKRKELEKQLYNEIKSQVKFWKNHMGNKDILIDSHQHTHMIPLIFKTLIKVIKDEGVNVKYLRVPAEPVIPYILTPALYFEYSFVGIAKQWLLKFLYAFNHKELKKSKIPTGYFMGVMFSGGMNKKRVKKLLVHYGKLAKKHDKNIEMGFHPGYVEEGEKLMEGTRSGFGKFYFSPLRRTEFDTLISLKF